MSNDEDFLSRKNDRRKKIKDKNVGKNIFEDKDDRIISKKIKQEIKKQKEEIDNEEWEDWDRYYNR